jgi:rubredoxin-NAD+ reductase
VLNYIMPTMEGRKLKWICLKCGFVYDEAEGWPEDGIAPGTPWDQVPQDWACPECFVAKSDFDMVRLEAAHA